ncbi:MAG TPA: protein kinase [Gemmatimonadales bacterium]|nr:protein kinase [Gemmatimonadales bacterium]
MSPVPDRLAAALSDRYTIERELGAGGMATVYLAEDLKHDRKVAVKVLRPELAAVLGADRFVQEIKTTAALQHPHILPLFDSGEADGFLFYVMPYVEGETLRQKLDRETQLSIDEAVKITTEVADALDYAHRHGVVHRDIKPENILLHDGRPMVADFGIALALSAAAGGRMTETGMSLGTPHYMSPEQATADKDITGRSDIYSLASVLYEMLTGNPPHVGSSAQQIIMKIIAEDVKPVTEFRKSVPANVAAATAKALEKLPADRFDSAKAFADALTNSAFTTVSAASAASAAPAALHRSRMTISLLAAACVALAAIAAWALLRSPPSPPTSRQRVVLWHRAPGRILDPGHARVQATQAAISPNGSTIVYSEPTDSGPVLMRKRRNEAVATPLAGTNGGMAPFFSPDGRWIGYRTADGKLKKLPATGGGSVTLATDAAVEVSAAAAWLDDGTIVYAMNVGLRRLNAAGDSSWALGPDSAWAGNTILTLSPLPKSRGVLYTLCRGNCAVASSVYAFDLHTGQHHLLVADAVGAWYAPPGVLLFTDRTGGLYGERFDVDRLAVTSGRVPLIPGVEPGNFTLARNGTVLYATAGAGSGGTPAELMWVARDGSAVPLDTTWKADFNYPAISPNGKTLAVSVRGATTQIWLRHADGAREPLTQHGTLNWRPAWTADGRSIVFCSNQGAGADSMHYDLYRMPVNHSSPAERLVHFPYPIWEGEESADGRWIVFRSDEEQGLSHIRARRVAGDTAIRPLLGGNGASADEIALSPDGRWIAYTLANGSTRSIEIYVAPFPSVTAPSQISQGDGMEPRWARNGRELFFKSGGRLMAVDVGVGPTLSVGSPHPLFSVLPYRSAFNRQEYDVAPDGRHFVMIRDVGEGSETVMYVEHWFTELEAKMRQ